MQYTKKYKVTSEDVVAIQPEQDVLYQECCDCGLQHRIEIVERGPTLRLRFVNIGHGAAEADSKARGYNGFETHIDETPNAE